VICYTLQIYFDFSGYSDMAIGLGRMFGFVFPENFNYPYVATSITDFWRRWHITLSSWFRDYVYIPLGGSRVSRGRVYFNLLTVFFLCGLWHGAMWTFVVWGLFHGAFLIVERMALKDWLARHRIIRHVYVLTAVMFGWAIFRSSTIGAAGVYILRLCFLGGHSEALYGRSVLVNHEVLAALIAGIALSMPIIPAMARLWDRITATATGWRATASELMARLIEMGALAMVFLVSLALCAEGTYNPFIYFRF
jgi:alginate O-acetyltransferase complex protein AlgI